MNCTFGITDFCAAWAEGGLRAYVYLEVVSRRAQARGDVEWVANMRWLQEVLDQRNASEVISRAHAVLKHPPAVTPSLNQQVIQEVRAIRRRIKIHDVLIA